MKVGILGAGTVTSGSHLPVLVNMPDVTVEWVCDRSAAAAQAVARSYGIEQVYTDLARCPDVDVVLVATPVGSRRVVVPQILARGWHAFCEKPFALGLAEHDAYLAAAAKHGVRIGVGQVRRYARPTASARRLLQRDFLGPLVRVSAAEGFRLRNTGRGSDWHMTDRAAGGGALMETGSHLVDQLLYVLDAEEAALLRCEQRIQRELELASVVHAQVRTARGESVECRMEVSIVEDLCNGIYLEFPNYVLKVGLFFDDALELTTRSGELLCRLEQEEGTGHPSEGFVLEWRDFLEECRRGEPSPVSAATVRTTTALIEASYARAEAAERAGDPDGVPSAR